MPSDGCADSVESTDEEGAMTVNSPESLPEDDPQQTAGDGGAEPKKDDDGGIPTGQEGVGLGATHEPNTFEPEEDPEAD
jgi:hypothetical protein